MSSPSPFKRLKCSEPDLLITVGTSGPSNEQRKEQRNNNNNNNGGKKKNHKSPSRNDESSEQKVYHHHSVIMAHYSNYIDTMLATPMKEQKSYELSFPEITPNEWENMMKYLQPEMSRTMPATMALKLAKWYDKYDFAVGRSVCDDVLYNYIVKMRNRHDNNVLVAIPEEMDLIVDSILTADEHHLTRTKFICIQVLHEILRSNRDRLFLQVHHVRRLSGLISRENGLLSAVRTFMWEWETTPRNEIEQQLSKPLFPELFVDKIQILDSVYSLSRSATKLVVEGAGVSDVNGIYQSGHHQYADHRTFFKNGTWDSRSVRFCIRSYTARCEWRLDACYMYADDDSSDDDDEDDVLAHVYICNGARSPCPLWAQHMPPRVGWVCAPGGKQPPPTLHFRNVI